MCKNKSWKNKIAKCHQVLNINSCLMFCHNVTCITERNPDTKSSQVLFTRNWSESKNCLKLHRVTFIFTLIIFSSAMFHISGAATCSSPWKSLENADKSWDESSTLIRLSYLLLNHAVIHKIVILRRSSRKRSPALASRPSNCTHSDKKARKVQRWSCFIAVCVWAGSQYIYSAH